MTPKKEPVLYASVAAALVGLAVVYGLVDAEEGKALTALVVALAPVVGGMLARRKTVPTSKMRRSE